jgi:hypothetical protein
MLAESLQESNSSAGAPSRRRFLLGAAALGGGLAVGFRLAEAAETPVEAQAHADKPVLRLSDNHSRGTGRGAFCPFRDGTGTLSRTCYTGCRGARCGLGADAR